MMRPHVHLAIIAALITATESAPPSHQDQKGATETNLLNEALFEAIKASSEPAPSTNQVRKGAAPIRILNTNNEEMGMSKVVM